MRNYLFLSYSYLQGFVLEPIIKQQNEHSPPSTQANESEVHSLSFKHLSLPNFRALIVTISQVNMLNIF